MLHRLLGWLLVFTLAACSGLPPNAVPPRVSVAAIDLKQIGVFEQHFDVGLRVANPNDFDLTVEALDFELEVNGRPFAHGLSRVSALVPAASSTVVRVDAIMQSSRLIEQIKRLAPHLLFDGVPYRISGRVKIDRSSNWLPFDREGVLGGDDDAPPGRKVRGSAPRAPARAA